MGACGGVGKFKEREMMFSGTKCDVRDRVGNEKLLKWGKSQKSPEGKEESWGCKKRGLSLQYGIGFER